MAGKKFILIGLTGKADVGKDTAASMIEVGYNFGRYSFATPLKQMINVMLGVKNAFNVGNWEDREWKEKVIPLYGKSPRQMAQTLGTEWGRGHVHTDLWLKVAEQRIEWLRGSDFDVNGCVISDVRFDNEAQWLAARGGWLIEIHRKAARSVASHSSEAGLSLTPEFEVHNDGTLHQFEERLDDCVMSILENEGVTL